MKTFLYGLAGTLIAIFLVAVFSLHKTDNADPVLGSSTENVNTVATTSRFILGNTPVLIAPTSTARTLARIVSTSTVMLLKYGAQGTASEGEPLISPLVFDLDHMYTGAVWAISGVTGTISVTEFSRP